MGAPETVPVATRMLFLGDAALTDGFQLIGFETWADPSPQQLEQVLQGLLNSRANAFVILDSRLAQQPSSLLQQIRSEGGRIIVTEVPPLNDPDNFHSEIDNRIQRLLGNALVDKSN